jgi:hypothetical protein
MDQGIYWNAHGFAVRGFTKLPIPDPDNDIENLYKPMTTSLRDALSSIKVYLILELVLRK